MVANSVDKILRSTIKTQQRTTFLTNFIGPLNYLLAGQKRGMVPGVVAWPYPGG